MSTGAFAAAPAPDAEGANGCGARGGGDTMARRAASPAAQETMRTVVQSLYAPRAIGPYSQAVVRAGWVFCSGQIPLDPATGEMVGAGDVRLQARQVMRNLGGVLEAAGATFADVVKTTIFLTDLADFAAVNEVYGAFFGAEPPARATVQVAGLPRGALVEIDAIAHLPEISGDAGPAVT